MSASMVAPALVDLERELHVNATISQVIMLITFLGFGIGEFVFAVLGEVLGRRPAWIAGNVWFILWNTIAPLRSSTELLIFGRLMSGIGASVSILVSCLVEAYKFTMMWLIWHNSSPSRLCRIYSTQMIVASP